MDNKYTKNKSSLALEDQRLLDETLKDYLRDFGDQQERFTQKSFVRGGTIQQDAASGMTQTLTGADVTSSLSASSRLYQPSMPISVFAEKHSADDDRRHDARAPPGGMHAMPAPPSTEKKSTKRHLDEILEELKSQHDGPPMPRSPLRMPTGASTDHPRHSYDHDGDADDSSSDPSNTNLMISPIYNGTVNEFHFANFFSQYGPIASYRLMPSQHSQHQHGFIRYMRRVDADYVVRHASRDILHAWQQQICLSNKTLHISFSSSQRYAPLPRCPVLQSEQHRHLFPSKITHALFNTEMLSPKESRVVVIVPPSDALRLLIHTTVEFVLRGGPAFEHAVVLRERENPAYLFLHDFTSPEHAYYRWKLYSRTQGDTENAWRTQPFQMIQGGPFWYPPPLIWDIPRPQMNEIEDSRDVDAFYRDKESYDTRNDRTEDAIGNRLPKSEEESEKTTLTEEEADAWQSLLESSTMSKFSVADRMVFYVEHAYASQQMVDTLVASLLNGNVLTRKLSLLFVISDILYQSKSSTLPYVFLCRAHVETHLSSIMSHLADIYHKTLTSRLKAEQFKNHCMNVLRVWQQWHLYTTIETLTRLFDKEDAVSTIDEKDTETLIETPSLMSKTPVLSSISTRYPSLQSKLSTIRETPSAQRMPRWHDIKRDDRLQERQEDDEGVVKGESATMTITKEKEVEDDEEDDGIKKIEVQRPVAASGPPSASKIVFQLKKR